MGNDSRAQWKLLLVLVALYALAAAVYVLIPGGGLAMAGASPAITNTRPSLSLCPLCGRYRLPCSTRRQILPGSWQETKQRRRALECAYTVRGAWTR